MTFVFGLPACVNIVIYIRVVGGHRQFQGRCEPWKVSRVAEKPILQVLKFQNVGTCRELLGWAVPLDSLGPC
jgi:hypothetical protein